MKLAYELLAITFGALVFIMLLGYAGDIDYCDQVILSMSEEEYDSVKCLLTQENGSEPSDREIAHRWADNR
jgi:hypothetical protein